MITAARVSAARPVMMAIAGDSASGKTTLAAGLVSALGRDRCTLICVDDYHRYSRAERSALGVTASNPDGNYLDVMAQHLQMLATGQPILKPEYDHRNGELVRPRYVEPRQYIVVEGLLPLYSSLARACFDVCVYLDPPEELRREWKLRRDCEQRGYTADQVIDQLALREPDSAQFIRPQRRYADVIVRFVSEAAQPAGIAAAQPAGIALAAELLLRPTIDHPPLGHLLTSGDPCAIELRIIRDNDGTPVDCLHVGGRPDADLTRRLKESVWSRMSPGSVLPDGLGELGAAAHSEPLAITQLLLLSHLTQEAYAL